MYILETNHKRATHLRMPSRTPTKSSMVRRDPNLKLPVASWIHSFQGAPESDEITTKPGTTTTAAAAAGGTGTATPHFKPPSSVQARFPQFPHAARAQQGLSCRVEGLVVPHASDQHGQCHWEVKGIEGGLVLPEVLAFRAGRSLGGIEAAHNITMTLTPFLLGLSVGIQWSSPASLAVHGQRVPGK